MFRLSLLAALVLSLSWNDPATAADKKQASDSKLATFEKTVLPILRARCTGCHSGTKPKAGLDLSTRRSVLAGSDKGAVVRLNAAESSRLWGVLASNRM
ncbi:MAG: c-type cytochrome domain-containing protein, partial [Planctomycetota bacterium]|nr:c-type cytochrome domain-containing protein [Planctomycetota bacterium]